jgi:DNA-binding NarL/FixJ family response regulator
MLKKGKSQHAIARELKMRLGTVGYHEKRLRATGQFT